MKSRSFLALLLCLNLTFYQTSLAQSPSGIVTDGRTQTTVTTNGNVTGITTNTVRGANGYNSFTTFNVGNGKTVNLYLPGSTKNLFNLVNGSPTTINGILNSIKDGQIGGRVFFINPYGMVVGSTGVINVGALTVLTPSKNFNDSLVDANGNVSEDATNAVLAGNIPLTSDGLILVRGRINAIGDIKLAAGQIVNAGKISTNTLFVAQSPNFGDVVNVKGLQAATQIGTSRGNIVILALSDFENSGTITTQGTNGVNGGNIDLRAGNDIRLIGSSLISSSGGGSNSNAGNITIIADGNAYLNDTARVEARGGSVSGNGGLLEFSAKGTLSLNGGSLKAGAVNGTAGTVTLDPTDLVISVNDTPNDGSNLNFTADDSITLNPGVTISSRQTASGADQLKGASTGNSGNISFTAPTITIGNGSSILANATGSNTAGDITLTASQSVTDPVVLPSISATTQINIGNATISGGNITMTATATAEANKTPSSAANGILNDTSLGAVVGSYGPVSYKAATATSTITIGDSKSAGTAVITGTGNVKISSTADAKAVSNLVGESGFAYGETDSTATTTVASNANVSATGTLSIESESKNTLSVKESTDVNSPGVIAVAYGNADSTSTTQIDGKVSGGRVEIKATNTNDFDTEASAKAFSASSSTAPANGGGAAVALGFYESNANTNVSGTVEATGVTPNGASCATAGTAGCVTISATSTNLQDAVFSSSAVPVDGGFGSKIAQAQNVVQNFGGYLSQARVFPTKAVGTGQVGKLGVSASVSYVEGNNTATTTVTGNVNSNGDISIGSTATDAPQIAAAGSVSGQATDLGGAVAISSFSNISNTYVKDGAQVGSLSGSTSITANATMVNPAVNRADLIADDQNFQDFESGAKSILKDIGTAVAIFGNPGQFATSFVNTGLTTQASDKGIQGDNVGLAGAVSVLSLTNQATASVTGTGTSVRVGYKADGSVDSSANGNVNIKATADLTSINVAGTGFSVGQVLKLNPGVNSGSSLGGSADVVTISNASTAYIGDGTTVKSATKGSENGQVNVSSDTKTFEVAVAQAGDKAQKFGVSGTVNYLDITDNSSAYIQSNAAVAATNDVNVSASNNLFDIAVGGALGWGGKAQLDVAVNWNELNQTTVAYIGDPANSRTSICTGCGVTAGKNVNVGANSTEHLYAVTFAAAASGNSMPSADGKKDAKQAGNGAGGGSFGFGLSGEIAINNAGSDDAPGITTKAFINNGAKVSATGGDVRLDADDSSVVVSAAVGGAFSGGAGVENGAALQGAYNQNTINKDVEAFTTNSTISGNGLTVDADGTGKLYAVTAGGAVDTNTGLALAGSVNNNSLTNTIQASVGDQTSASNLGSDGVTVSADVNDSVLSIAGAISYASKGASVGAGIDMGDYTNNVDAYVGNANLGATGNIQITASTREDLNNFGASIGIDQKGLMAVGSLTYETLNNDTEAYIADNATVSTSKNILLGSNDYLKLFEVAGAIGGSGNVAIGASADVNDLNRTSKAYVGKNAKVTANGDGTAPSFNSQSSNGLALFALSNGSLETYAAGGTGAGKVAFAGSAVVNMLTDTTYAYVDESAQVNLDNSKAASGQNVSLLAYDTTNIRSLAGGVAIGGTAGIGAGGDVATVHKDTEAWIGKSAQVNAAANVEVQAVSNEDFGSTAGAIAGGGSAGIAGAGSVYIIDDKTLANVNSLAKVFSKGNVLISAQDLTDLDQTAGDIAGGGSAGVGGSAAVADITKDTEAHIQMGASVTALGLAPAIQADTGQFTYTYVSNHGFGEVPAAGVTVAADPDPALAGQQVATPVTAAFTGVAVTAVSNTSTHRLTVAGSGSGGLAASLAGSVDLETLTTTASIDSQAKVNVESDSGAGTDQSVLVASGSNVSHMGMLGALALSGSVGIGPSADISLVSNNTTASIGESANVHAKDSIGVNANAAEHFLSIAAGAAGSGNVSVAGAVSVVSLTDMTKSEIGKNAMADAGGNILVSANDATSTDLIDGGVAIGGVAGVSGSVGVTLITKDTEASIGSGAQVDAKGNSSDTLSLINTHTIHGLAVQANSTENLFNAAAGGAGGVYGGIAGDVTVENVQATTKAYVGDGAQINQSNTGANSAQAVEVLAQDATTIKAYSIASAGSVAVGIAGAVNVSTVDNTTSAYVGNNADVDSLGSVSIAGNSSVTGADGEISAGIGAAAVAGAVSVWNINSGLGSDEHFNNGSAVSSYTSAAGSTSVVTGMLSSSDPDQQQALDDVNNTTLSTSTSAVFNTTPAVVPGTSAFVGSNTDVNAGGNLSVRAKNTLDLNVTDGSGGIGWASFGGAVAVVNIGSETQAYADSDSTLSAGRQLSIDATLDEPKVSINTLAGMASVDLSVGVSYINLSDTANTKAYLASGAQATSKDSMEIKATTTRTANAETGGLSVGAGIAAGISLSNITLGGETKAYLDNGAQVGSSDEPSGGLTVEAIETDKGTATATPLAGGVITGVGGKTKVEINPTVSAYDDGASVNVSGGMSVKASDSSTVESTVKGQQFVALVSGGSVDAQGDASPTVSAYVTGGTVDAGSIDVEATGSQSMTVSGTSSQYASFVSGMSISATGTLTPTISASVDGGAILTANGEASVNSSSTNTSSVTADGSAGYFNVGSGGTADATATITNTVSTTIGEATITSTAGKLTVQSGSNNTITNATSTTKSGSGIVNVGGATTNATITDTVSTTLGSGADLEAQSGELLVESDGSERVVASSSNPNGLSGVAQSEATTNVTVTANVKTKLQDGANVNGKNTTIKSALSGVNAYLDAGATSNANAKGVLGVGAYATSTINTTANSGVEISGGATVAGNDSLNLDAKIGTTSLRNTASADAKAGIVPISEATAVNNATLTAKVNVAPGTNLTSNALTVTSNAPSPGFSSNTPSATYTFYAIFGIPIHGHGSEDRGGTATSTNSINLNGVLHQSANLPALVVNADGTATGSLVGDVTEDANNVVLNDITGSNSKETVHVNTNNGTVTGSLEINSNLLLVNNSDRNLVVQDVSTQRAGGGDAVTFDGDSQHTGFTSIVGPMPITIQNNGASNVIFTGNIADSGGSLAVTNQGGSILGTQGNTIQVSSANLFTPNGEIGSTGGEIACLTAGCPSSALQLSGLNLSLTPSLEPVTGTLSPGQLSAVARNDVNLNLTADATALTALPAGSAVPVQLNRILAGGDVNLTLNSGLVGGGHAPVNSDYQIRSGDWAGAGGLFNVVLNGADGASPTLTVDGALTSGFDNVSVTANADGTFTSLVSAAGQGSAELNYARAIGGAVQIADIDASRSGINITGTGSLAGTGTVMVLNGASDITVANHTDQVLAVNTITSGAAGSLNVAPTVSASLTPTTYGSSSGRIDVSSDSTSINLQKQLSDPNGTISITSGADITGAPGTTLIRSKNIDLAAAGNIGPDLGVEMTQPSGVLNARANGSIGLNAIGDINTGSVSSQMADVSISSSGSILSAASMYQPNVSGRNITFSADGTIGNSEAWLSTQVAGTLNASAGSGIYLRQISGDLNSESMVSRDGGINIVVDKGNGYFQEVRAPKNVLVWVNGIALNLGTIDSDKIRIMLAGKGGAATVGNMFAGTNVDFVADISHILRLIHTKPTNPLFLNITTTDGGYNLRPIEPETVLMNSLANIERRERERRFGHKNRAEQPENYVIDNTSKTAEPGVGQ